MRSVRLTAADGFNQSEQGWTSCHLVRKISNYHNLAAGRSWIFNILPERSSIFNTLKARNGIFNVLPVRTWIFYEHEGGRIVVVSYRTHFTIVLNPVLPRPRQSEIWVRDEFYLGPLKQLTYNSWVYIAMVDYKRQIHFPFLCGLNKEDLHCK